MQNLIDSGKSLNLKDIVSQCVSSSQADILVKSAARLRELARYVECLELIDQSLKSGKSLSALNVSTLRHLRCDVLMDFKKFNEAIKCYSSILSTISDEEVAYANRALAKWELKRYKQALNDYLCAIQLNSANVITLRGAGEMLIQLRQSEKAIPYLKNAIKIDPHYSEAHTALGVAFYRTKNWLKAYRSLKKAIALDPTNSRARLGIDKLESHFGLND